MPARPSRNTSEGALLTFSDNCLQFVRGCFFVRQRGGIARMNFIFSSQHKTSRAGPQQPAKQQMTTKQSADDSENISTRYNCI